MRSAGSAEPVALLPAVQMPAGNAGKAKLLRLIVTRKVDVQRDGLVCLRDLRQKKSSLIDTEEVDEFMAVIEFTVMKKGLIRFQDRITSVIAEHDIIADRLTGLPFVAEAVRCYFMYHNFTKNPGTPGPTKLL